MKPKTTLLGFIFYVFVDWFSWRGLDDGEIVWRAWWTVAVLNSIYFFTSCFLGYPPYGGKP